MGFAAIVRDEQIRIEHVVVNDTWMNKLLDNSVGCVVDENISIADYYPQSCLHGERLRNIDCRNINSIRPDGLVVEIGVVTNRMRSIWHPSLELGRET